MIPWLEKKINYNNKCNYHVIKECILYIYEWIQMHDEIFYDTDFNIFFPNMIIFLVNEYIYHKKYIFKMNKDTYDIYNYFQMKYSDDIYNLFISLKNITKSNNCDLFNGNVTYEPLLYYLSYICDCKDPYLDDLLDENDELECTIYNYEY